MAKNTGKNTPSISLDDVISSMQGIGQNIATLAQAIAAQNTRIDTLERIATAPKETPQSKDAGKPAQKDAEKIGAAHPEDAFVKGTVTKIAASHKGIRIDSVTGWLNVAKTAAPFFTSDRVTVGDKVKLSIDDGLVTGMSVKRGKTATSFLVEQAAAPTTETVKGTLTKTHRGGMSCWIQETGQTYYNATKAAGPIFKDIAAGTRVEIDAILSEGSQPKATAVRVLKDAGKPSKTGKNAPKDAPKNVAAAAPSKPESVTMSLAAESEDGCEHCGAKHGKNGKAIVILECSMRQYMKSENVKLDVASDESLQAYLDWRAARILEVSESRGTSVILKGSKYVAPEATKRGPGRPKGSKNAPKGADPKAGR